MQDNIKMGVLFALSTALIGSVSAAVGKVLAGQINPWVMVFWQFLICVLTMMPRLLKNHRSLWYTNELKTHLVRGAGGVLGFYGFYFALKSVPLVDGVLLRNTGPLFVPLLAWLWLRVVVPRNRWLPLIVGFIGVVLVLKTQLAGIEKKAVGASWFDYGFGLMAGVGYAISMVGTRVLSKTESAGTIMFYYFLLSFLISMPMAVLHWQAIPEELWGFVVLIGVSVSASMWTYTKAYEYARPSIISPISYFAVIFSGLIGWLVWEYVPGFWAFIGMLLVVLAGMMTVYLSQRKQPAA